MKKSLVIGSDIFEVEIHKCANCLKATADWEKSKDDKKFANKYICWKCKKELRKI